MILTMICLAIWLVNLMPDPPQYVIIAFIIAGFVDVMFLMPAIHRTLMQWADDWEHGTFN